MEVNQLPRMMYPMTPDLETMIIEPRPMPGFVTTPYIKDITKRVSGYIKAGFPVHFRGISGTGKTTLALHIASLLKRPVVLMHGDDEHTTGDLVGGEHGYRFKRLRDNFISSVLKEEENFSKSWIDNRLTVACKYGFTLIYDEFTRSRPEANNILLSILQEGVMDLPPTRDGDEAYLRVHPDFVAIFTSNPEEYAGVHKAQDALRDRMVTIDLGHFDHKTEVEITSAKSGLPRVEAEKIVDVVRALRDSKEYEFAPTIRGCLMIAKSARVSGIKIAASDPAFQHICQDILASETSRLGSHGKQEKVKQLVEKFVNKYC